MSLPLQDKVALVTGGARGIGAAIARRLAQAGCHVAVNYYNSSEEAEALCKEIEGLGRKSVAIQADVSNADSIKEMFEAFGKTFDKLDILVSNAASGVLKPAMKMKVKHWRWCMETNALSMVLLAQAAKPLMGKGGRVLVLSSMGARRAVPNYAFVGASKAALESLTRSMALELAPDGISVNCISAGVVDTDALKYFPNHDQLLEEFKNRNLTGGELKPEHVADAAYLLCLPEAEMIKGQTIFVDAGYSILG